MKQSVFIAAVSLATTALVSLSSCTDRGYTLVNKFPISETLEPVKVIKYDPVKVFYRIPVGEPFREIGGCVREKIDPCIRLTEFFDKISSLRQQVYIDGPLAEEGAHILFQAGRNFEDNGFYIEVIIDCPLIQVWPAREYAVREDLIVFLRRTELLEDITAVKPADNISKIEDDVFVFHI